MVRTADNALRVAGGKSTRKGGNVSVRQESSRSRSPSSSSGDRGTGSLNPICPRETPSWQKPITNFFTAMDKSHYHSKAEHQSSSSKIAAGDFNMMEDDDDHQNIPGPSKHSCVEDMDEEFQEIRIDKHENNKENTSPNESNIHTPVNDVSGDTEMGEFNGRMKKCFAREDADEEMVPAKRFKLSDNMYEHLQELEQL